MGTEAGPLWPAGTERQTETGTYLGLVHPWAEDLFLEAETKAPVGSRFQVERNDSGTPFQSCSFPGDTSHPQLALVWFGFLSS